MRILYLTHSVSWKGGGIFFTAYHQGRYLVARGHDVTLVSISPTEKLRCTEQTVAGVRIIEAPDMLRGKARSGWDPWDTVRRIGYLRNVRYDLVHGFESRPAVAIPALYCKHAQRIPLIFTWADWFGHGGKGSERGRLLKHVLEPIETFCEEYFYPKADRCIAMGKPLAERAIALGMPAGKVFELLHGCDAAGIAMMSIAEARRRLPNLPQNGIMLGYLGVLRPSSAELLFSAFRTIRQHTPGACKLALIGNHKLPLADYLPEDLRADVIETGWLPYEEVNFYLEACNLLLLPFQRAIATDNVWPSKLNDYLAAGRPIVATNMRVLVPLFESTEIGRLTSDHPDDFALGCVELLSDEVRCHRMGEKARALAEGELSWGHIVDRLEDLYLDVVMKNRHAGNGTPTKT